MGQSEMQSQAGSAYPNQPGLVQAAQGYNTAHNTFWSTGLCEWCAEPGGCGLCCCAACCACITYGQTVEKLGPQATCGGSCCGAGSFYCLMVALGFWFVPQLITRGEIRRMNGMRPGTASDFLIGCFCSSCGLCQESREVDIRGGAAATKAASVNTPTHPPQTQTMTQNY